MSSCSICSEVYDVDLVASRCGHVYHDRCIRSWMMQKHSCPLCKADVQQEHLTSLHFNPKTRLTALQQQHTVPAAADTSASSSSSPFTLCLRLQALRQQRDDIRLRILQRGETSTSLRSSLAALQSSLSAAAQTRSLLAQQMLRAEGELVPLEKEVATLRTQWKRMRRVHARMWRHLLVQRGLRCVKRMWRRGRENDRDAGAGESKEEAGESRQGQQQDELDGDEDEAATGLFVDVERVVRQEEGRMPVRRIDPERSEDDEHDEPQGRRGSRVDENDENDSRQQAMDLLIRVLLRDAQSQLDAAQRDYKLNVTDKRDAAARLKREEAAINRERKTVKDRRDALLAERKAVQAEREAIRGRRQPSLAANEREPVGASAACDGNNSDNNDEVIILDG